MKRSCLTVAFALLCTVTLCFTSCEATYYEIVGRIDQMFLEKHGTSGLEYITLPDGTFGVSVGEANESEEIFIPEEFQGVAVTAIVGYAFKDCVNLKKITIPSSVKSIGSFAFAGCTALTEVTLPSSVTSIEYYAFSGCSELTALILGENSQLENIDYYAFENCSALKSIDIPASVILIGSSLFIGCSELESINVDEGNEFYCSIDGNLYNKEKTVLLQYATGKTDESFTVPSGVKNIGVMAFFDCRSLRSITIPDSVTSIGGIAFENCFNLTTINFTGSETAWNAIGKDAYWDGDLGDYTINFNYKP